MAICGPGWIRPSGSVIRRRGCWAFLFVAIIGGSFRPDVHRAHSIPAFDRAVWAKLFPHGFVLFQDAEASGLSATLPQKT